MWLVALVLAALQCAVAQHPVYRPQTEWARINQRAGWTLGREAAQLQLSMIPEEDCMSIPQLKEAVKAAAYNTTVDGSPRSGVIITLCDIVCLKSLFEPFMWSIEHSRDGNFAQHVIIIGLGLPAYVYCDKLRHKHKHHCVLDRRCLPPGRPPRVLHGDSYEYGTTSYFHALVQKLQWGQEVLNLGVSVMWTDMDIFYFQSPLPFLFNVAPDADLLVESEYWDKDNLFEGEVCYNVKPRSPPPGAPYCHGFVLNGGLWLFNPTPQGKLLLQAWAGRVFEDSVVQGRLWNGSSTLDQTILSFLTLTNRGVGSSTTVSQYKWVPSTSYSVGSVGGQWVNHANITRLPDESIYRLSMRRMAGVNFGPCGMMGNNVGFNWYFVTADGVKQPRDYEPVGNPAIEQLVCVMPRRCVDRMISQHKNGMQPHQKRTYMIAWMNFTVDEEQFRKEGRLMEPPC